MGFFHAFMPDHGFVRIRQRLVTWLFLPLCRDTVEVALSYIKITIGGLWNKTVESGMCQTTAHCPTRPFVSCLGGTQQKDLSIKRP